jgi:hypothetical protein
LPTFWFLKDTIATQPVQELPMADREMIAATLAAALLTNGDFSDSNVDTAKYAVTIYHKVLANLDAAPTRTPLPPPKGRQISD